MLLQESCPCYEECMNERGDSEVVDASALEDEKER